MIVLHTKSIFVVRTFLLSWYDTICQVRMLYRDSVNKPPAGSLGNGSFFKYCMIMYKVHARHCFFDCMKMPSNAGTKILEKQGATEFPLPPGQEAMCPCDWAEKIFGLTRWLQICPSLPYCSVWFGATYSVWCYCKEQSYYVSQSLASVNKAAEGNGWRV